MNLPISLVHSLACLDWWLSLETWRLRLAFVVNTRLHCCFRHANRKLAEPSVPHLKVKCKSAFFTVKFICKLYGPKNTISLVFFYIWLWTVLHAKTANITCPLPIQFDIIYNRTSWKFALIDCIIRWKDAYLHSEVFVQFCTLECLLDKKKKFVLIF